ncbi:hypothetical protein QBC43DRAFT_135661 [Cladorrhinum sp. PSN259]|nr:hypothetical protein QBC43DRAFT_135661 [Cladorrhinum sp. PSN259]
MLCVCPRFSIMYTLFTPALPTLSSLGTKSRERNQKITVRRRILFCFVFLFLFLPSPSASTNQKNIQQKHVLCLVIIVVMYHQAPFFLPLKT